MNQLSEKKITCPYCGQNITVLIDSTDLDQTYIEDCQVCCQPINISVYQNTQGELTISAISENETL